MAYPCAASQRGPGWHAETPSEADGLPCPPRARRPALTSAGWSLSPHAAQEYGVSVVGRHHLPGAEGLRRRAHRRAGLEDRVEIRLQDYRDVPDEPFDTISSIEMGEHVGERNYPVYAAQIHRLLRPGGRMLVQQMSRTTRPGGGPFIEAFIAPDMHMRPVGETVGFFERAGLEVRDVHAMREHYVRTVDAWYATFEENWDCGRPGRRGGGPRGAHRGWRARVRGGLMGVDQILAVRPSTDGRAGPPGAAGVR
jgi:cyclopropane-fatty-acyl-phospholipid synthase